MYVAEGDKIYYCHPNETGSKELFLTVHPTKDCTKTPEEQAVIIVKTLNDD
jgi:hypothetical protein